MPTYTDFEVIRSIDFDAEAGRIYRIRVSAEEEHGPIYVWVEMITVGRATFGMQSQCEMPDKSVVVAGQAPPDYPPSPQTLFGKAVCRENTATETTLYETGDTTFASSLSDQLPVACSDARDPEKPWVGNWTARTDKAILTLNIQEQKVQGQLKTVSHMFSVLGKVNEQGFIDGNIYGNSVWDRADIEGKFPDLRITEPVGTLGRPALRELDGQAIRLCS